MSMTDRIAALEPDTFMCDSWQDGYYAARADVLKLMANDTVRKPTCTCTVYGGDACDIHGANHKHSSTAQHTLAQHTAECNTTAHNK